MAPGKCRKPIRRGRCDADSDEEGGALNYGSLSQPSTTSGGGFFSYFFSPPPAPRSPSPQPEVRPEDEAEAMRKRGWLPPGVKRQVSLRQRLSTRKQRKEKNQNPFLGGKKDDNPFNDPEGPAMVDVDDEEEHETRDVDDFFEMERPDGADSESVNGKVCLRSIKW